METTAAMRMAGIADEAGKALDAQIRAHRELGWKHIEIRNVDGTNLTDVDDRTFETIRERVLDAGLSVCCFGGQIANWSRKISGDFQVDVAELERAIPRMKKLGTRYIRIMSWPNDGWVEQEWRKEVIRRLKELASMAADGGVVLAHENCSGWGGQRPDTARDVIESVNSPALRSLLDTGNRPHQQGTPVQVYEQVRESVVHVHIKDFSGSRFVYPGEGEAGVGTMVEGLVRAGYPGIFSIEPHMAAVVHEHKEIDDTDAAYRIYVEYGRKAEALVAKALKLAV